MLAISTWLQMESASFVHLLEPIKLATCLGTGTALRRGKGKNQSSSNRGKSVTELEDV